MAKNYNFDTMHPLNGQGVHFLYWQLSFSFIIVHYYSMTPQFHYRLTQHLFLIQLSQIDSVLTDTAPLNRNSCNATQLFFQFTNTIFGYLNLCNIYGIVKATLILLRNQLSDQLHRILETIQRISTQLCVGHFKQETQSHTQNRQGKQYFGNF